MTRKDLELLARALCYCESHCDNDTESDIVEWVTEKIADHIAVDHPRFNRGRFEKAANPIKSRFLAESIVAQLKDDRS